MESSLSHTRGVLRPGRAVSRRAVLRTGLAISPVLLAGIWGAPAIGRALTVAPTAGATRSGQVPACVVTPQQTEGPYFVDEKLFRSDIREDPMDGTVKEGVPLRLTFRVAQVTGGACGPLPGAVLDIWQCDALGSYSDVRDPGGSTVGQKFLRGSQMTDDSGTAEFLTIYPGWYMGRTVHIHFKLRTDPDSETGYEFTSQLYFDDGLTDLVHARSPYAAKGSRDTRNSNDGVFRGGGEQLLLQIGEEGDGYAATIDIGVDLSAPAPVPGPVGPGGPPPPR